MADYDYWHKQGEKVLFSEVDTERPEQRRMAGKILIIGGNNGAFFTVAHTMTEAQQIGAGAVRVLLPSSLSNKVPSTPEVFFTKAESSGAFGKDSVIDMLEHDRWADEVAFVGDIGKNAETSLAVVDFLKKSDKPVFLMRDAVDAVTQDAAAWSSMRDVATVILATVPQLQKLLRALYYPKIITLSMPTNQLVETLHKFTSSYDMTIATLHNGQILIAQNGEVVTMDLQKTGYTPISLWEVLLGKLKDYKPLPGVPAPRDFSWKE